jgi:hypothetical protein
MALTSFAPPGATEPQDWRLETDVLCTPLPGAVFNPGEPPVCEGILQAGQGRVLPGANLTTGRSLGRRSHSIQHEAHEPWLLL